MVGKAWATLHIIAGSLLVCFALFLWLLAGLGFSESDYAEWLNIAPVPWLAVFAVPLFVARWKSQNHRRMIVMLAAVCATLAVTTVVLDYLTTYPCNPSPADPQVDDSPCTGMPLWATPLAAAWIFLGRLALAAPLLAARNTSVFIAAATLFLLGAVVGIIPSPIPAWNDWQYIRFLGSFLALMGLGIAYATMGIADLRNGSSTDVLGRHALTHCVLVR